MPLAYPSGTVAEHLACRADAVVFDVSHLGTVRVGGTDALATLQLALCNDLSKVGPGRAQYTQLLNDEGGVLDDIIVWWVDDDALRRHAERLEHLAGARRGRRRRRDRGSQSCSPSKGPGRASGWRRSAPRRRRSDASASRARRSRATPRWWRAPATPARTASRSPSTTTTPRPSSRPSSTAGVTPAGLGARDTLRLEAALPLHGHELSRVDHPARGGSRVGRRLGQAGVRRPRRAHGAARRWALRGRCAASSPTTRQPPRDGAVVRRGDAVLGTVTSGNFSPVLGRGIALALVDAVDPPIAR